VDVVVCVKCENGNGNEQVMGKGKKNMERKRGYLK